MPAEEHSAFRRFRCQVWHYVGEIVVRVFDNEKSKIAEKGRVFEHLVKFHLEILAINETICGEAVVQGQRLQRRR